MRDFIAESVKDLSIGFIVGSVIAILIEQKVVYGASIVFFIGISFWTISFIIKKGGDK